MTCIITRGGAAVQQVGKLVHAHKYWCIPK